MPRSVSFNSKIKVRPISPNPKREKVSKPKSQKQLSHTELATKVMEYRVKHKVTLKQAWDAIRKKYSAEPIQEKIQEKIREKTRTRIPIKTSHKSIDYDKLSAKEYDDSIKTFTKYVVDKYRDEARNPLNVLDYTPEIFNDLLDDYTSVRPVPWQNDTRKKNEIYDDIFSKVSKIIKTGEYVKKESKRSKASKSVADEIIDEVLDEMIEQTAVSEKPIKKYKLKVPIVPVKPELDIEPELYQIYATIHVAKDENDKAEFEEYVTSLRQDWYDLENLIDKSGEAELIKDLHPDLWELFLEADNIIVELESLIDKIPDEEIDETPEEQEERLDKIAKLKEYVDALNLEQKLAAIKPKGHGLSAKTRARRFAGDISKGTGTGSKATDDILKKYGDWRVRGINVLRSPVESFVQTVSNWLSSGEFNKLKGKYDDIYHLAGVVWITDPKTGKDVYLKTERRPKIQWDVVKQYNVPVTDKLKSIMVNLDNIQPTLNDMVHDAIKITYGGTQFDTYDPVYSNCQRYILGLVNGMYKALGKSTPSDLVAWISQDVTDLAKKSPIFHKVGKFITDLAGKFQAGDLDDDDELAW